MKESTTMTNEMIEEKLAQFDERYYNKNTPSGLNQSFVYQKKMVDDIRNNFLTTFYKQILEADIKTMEGMEVGMGDKSDADIGFQSGYNDCLYDLLDSKREALKKL